MHKYGRGESALTEGGAQFEAIISVGEFGATVWDFQDRRGHVGIEGPLIWLIPTERRAEPSSSATTTDGATMKVFAT